MDQVEKYDLFSTSNLQEAGEILGLLNSAGLALGTAESLTGGLLSAIFTAIPGASEVFTGGITVYQTPQKHNLLGVSNEVLQTYGPVSLQCADSMARGTLTALNCDVSICTTGVAGPDRDERGTEVGTVYISCAYNQIVETKKFKFNSELSRHQIRLSTIKEALSFASSFFKSCVGPLP